MEAKKETKIEVKLILTEDEARWLRALVQNPICSTDPMDEQPKDRQMRQKFWDALIFLD